MRRTRVLGRVELRGESLVATRRKQGAPRGSHENDFDAAPAGSLVVCVSSSEGGGFGGGVTVLVTISCARAPIQAVAATLRENEQ